MTWKLLCIHFGSDQITTIRQKMDSLVDMSVSYNDGIVEANLTKSISLSSPVNDLARLPVYLFFAKGKTVI